MDYLQDDLGADLTVTCLSSHNCAVAATPGGFVELVLQDHRTSSQRYIANRDLQKLTVFIDASLAFKMVRYAAAPLFTNPEKSKISAAMMLEKTL